MNGYMTIKLTPMRRVLRWLFPSRPLPYEDAPDWSKDGMYIVTYTHLSFVDRLRVLVGGKLRVETRTWCEHAPGRVETACVAEPTYRSFP